MRYELQVLRGKDRPFRIVGFGCERCGDELVFTFKRRDKAYAVEILRRLIDGHCDQDDEDSHGPTH